MLIANRSSDTPFYLPLIKLKLNEVFYTFIIVTLIFDSVICLFIEILIFP